MSVFSIGSVPYSRFLIADILVVISGFLARTQSRAAYVIRASRLSSFPYTLPYSTESALDIRCVSAWTIYICDSLLNSLLNSIDIGKQRSSSHRDQAWDLSRRTSSIRQVCLHRRWAYSPLILVHLAIRPYLHCVRTPMRASP